MADGFPQSLRRAQATAHLKFYAAEHAIFLAFNVNPIVFIKDVCSQPGSQKAGILWRLFELRNVKFQSRELCYMTKVSVEGEEDNSMLEGKSCNEGIDGGQSHTSRARKPD